MGTKFISRIIPMQNLRQFSNRNPYSNIDENELLLQACYENPLFEEEGTVINDTQTKLHRQTDGLRTKPYDLPNAAQTSVHYRPSKPKRRKGLYILGLLLAVVAIIAIITIIIVGQRGKFDM
jgi:hypothetical protein